MKMTNRVSLALVFMPVSLASCRVMPKIDPIPMNIAEKKSIGDDLLGYWWKVHIINDVPIDNTETQIQTFQWNGKRNVVHVNTSIGSP